MEVGKRFCQRPASRGRLNEVVAWVVKCMHKSCGICNRMFETQDENARMCDLCKEEYEHNRKICRDYLIGHRGTTLAELSRITGLPVRKIMVLIEDGAIDYVE